MQVDEKIEYKEDDFIDEYKIYYKRIINYLEAQTLNLELKKKCSEEIFKELYRCQSRRYPLHLVIDDVCEFCNSYIRKNKHLIDFRIVISRYIEIIILALFLAILSEAAFMRHKFWIDYFYFGTFSLSFLIISVLFIFFRKQLAILLIHRYKIYITLSIILSLGFGALIANLPEKIYNMYNYSIIIDSVVLYLLVAIYFLTLFYRLVILRKKPQRN